MLILMARDTLSDHIKGLDAGLDDYLGKPFELREVHARLRALIRRSAGQARAIIKTGDIAIDTAEHLVR